MTGLLQIVRQHSGPLEPLPTALEPREQRLDGIQAVLFDIYGTLLISSSGDVEASGASDRAKAFEEALQAVGVSSPVDGRTGVLYLTEAIRNAHKRAHEQGIEYPEVDIRDIWGETLARLPGLNRAAMDLETLAVHYELRVNPVWPMPNLRDCLRLLKETGLQLGLISNAQFVTPILFPGLVGQSLDELGFSPDLRFYSYQHRQAKPGRLLYELAADALAARSILPERVLYVGNDMLKDVLPAQQIGFRTALFAGDARSLRERQGDGRLARIEADVIVNDLLRLIWCVGRR